MNISSAVYYSGRIAHRVTLCFAVGSTILHWIMMIVIASNFALVQSLENTEFRDSKAINNDISQIVNSQSMIVLRWVIIASIATALLVLIKRFRKYEKPLLIDSAVVLIFCFVSVALSNFIIRTFLAKIVT